MGILDGFEGTGIEVGCSVGTIVWVRRRNGSWWPGKILGAEELADSHLMSPRSGTPVKLLGREDASVDWYNLEKSKRVKAFRCGEFDDCIEKVESLHGAPIKKREKYARREDAILHALELEKQQLERNQQKLGNANANNARTKVHIGVKKEMGIPLGKLGNNCKLLNLKSQNGLGSSEKNTENSLYAQKPKNVKGLSLQNGKCETTHRMGGLQDFEQRATSTSGCRSVGGANYDSSKNSLLSLKRKRTPVALIDEFPAKKHDIRRPPVQVLKSSAKLLAFNSLHSNGGAASEEKERTGGICRAKRSQYVHLPAVPNDKHMEFPSDQMEIYPSQIETESSDNSSTEDDSSSGLKEGVESDFSERDYLNGDMDEQTDVFSGSVPIDTGSRHFARLVNNYRAQRASMSSEELEWSASTTHMSHLRPRDQFSAGTYDGGVSKWQLKGKRNSRNLMKRPMEMDGSICNGLSRGSNFEGRGRGSSSQGAFYPGEGDFSYGYDGGDLIDKSSMHNQVLGSGRRYQPMFKAKTEDIDSDDGLVWGMDGLSRSPVKRYWDGSEECYDPIYVGHRFGNRRKSMLVDVDLMVQASSCQGEHVPLISLMSRLNGKAIIGHPVQIEIIEDGSTDHILSRNNEEPTEKDGSTALAPVWRTARRTVMHRIPHPHPSKAFERKYPSNSIPPTQEKLNRLIKAGDGGLTTITCIPVKLAFSRLMEAVGRPPSRTANDIERRRS